MGFSIGRTNSNCPRRTRQAIFQDKHGKFSRAGLFTVTFQFASANQCILVQASGVHIAGEPSVQVRWPCPLPTYQLEIAASPVFSHGESFRKPAHGAAERTVRTQQIKGIPGSHRRCRKGYGYLQSHLILIRYEGIKDRKKANVFIMCVFKGSVHIIGGHALPTRTSSTEVCFVTCCRESALCRMSTGSEERLWVKSQAREVSLFHSRGSTMGF